MSDENPLIKYLEDATSQNLHVLKAAEEQLKVWEQQPKFYQAILNICYDYNISQQVRWFAALHFKNGVDKYWRCAPSKRVISDEEKKEIRSTLISNFHEPVSQISVQLAVVIGRIARTDLRFWPQLIPRLLQEVKSSESLVQQNALLTLNHVIKSLMSKRLVSDRKIFKEVSSGIFVFILESYFYHLNQLTLYDFARQVQDVVCCLKLSILNLKVLRKLIVGGYDVNLNNGYVNLLEVLIDRIPLLIQKRAEYQAVLLIREKLQSLIENGLKALAETQKYHPILFANVLEKGLGLVINSVFDYSAQDVLFDTFVVYCCNLMRSVIECKEYKVKREQQIEDSVASTSLEAQKIIQRLLTPDTIKNICQQLILRYFPLTAQELEEWEHDPESYLAEEAGDSDNCLMKPCCETLFLSLYYQYRQVFTAVTSELLASLNDSEQNESDEKLIKKEAVYFSLGLASYELFGDLNFDLFFQDFLIKELQNDSPRMKIIRRRILWLIGRWIDVSFTTESRIILYQVIAEMLRESQDLVIRVTACQTLRDAIDDFQFKKEDFLPFLMKIWNSLFRLILDVQQSDNKMTVLSVMSLLIERIETEIRPMSAALSEYLPRLWADSADHNMLRCLVLTTFSHLVKALGSESIHLHNFLMPIIKFSTDQSQAAHVYLLEDGLDLWLDVTENCTSMTEELLALFEILPILLEQVSENFRACVKIMKAYILLDVVSVLRIHSTGLVRVVGSLIGKMKAEGNIMIAQLIEDVFITLPCHGPVVFEDVLVDLLKVVISDEEYPPVLISYLTLFGYTILNNLAVFNRVLQKACEGRLDQVGEVAGRFIDIWLDKVDCMTKDETKKLTTMALVSLLPLNIGFVNDRFALILDTAVNAMYNQSVSFSEDENAQQSLKDQMCSGESSKETLNEGRRRKLRSSSPVITTPLVQFVKQAGQNAKRALGVEQFQNLMETLDLVVSQQLYSLID